MVINQDYIVNPFEHIALAFSGGGFRAAAYALGVMSYLNEVEVISEDSDTNKKMLEHVTYLSSASGGSFATTLYALNIANKKSFADFYKNLFENLEGSNLLEKALEELSNKANWPKENPKKRNLINAFAKAYDKYLFNSASISDLKSNDPILHLEEVCFNATEFYRGLLFRQAIKLKHDALPDDGFLYGNYILHVDQNQLEKLKLGDLLAASSCFPAGFEPIIFPNDFVNNNTERKALINALRIEPQEISKTELNYLYGKEGDTIDINKYTSVKELQKDILNKKLRDDFSFGLMDGGITDNQGLESLMRANERRERGETSFRPFDLMLINDVGSHYMDPLKPNDTYNNKGISLNKLLFIITILLVVITTGAVLAFVSAGKPEDIRFDLYKVLIPTISLTVIFAIPIFLLCIGLWFIVHTQKKLTTPDEYGVGLKLHKTFSQKIIDLLVRYFFKTPISTIKVMLTDRVKSVLSLNNDVFLKRVRYLLYQRFFSTDTWKLRKKSNHIYDLSFTNDVNRIDHDKNAYPPSTVMQIVAEKAYQMSTTLWFDKKDTQEQTKAFIIACGQFTTCYNLLLYTDTIIQNEVMYSTASNKKRVDHIKKQLEAHYQAFFVDPFWLYNKTGQKLYNAYWKNIELVGRNLPDEFKNLRRK